MSQTAFRHFDFELPGWAEFAAPPRLRIPYEAEVLADQPVVYLRLADSSGAVATDVSGNGHHGSYVGTVAYAQPGALTAGHGDLAVKLPGSGGHLTVGSGVIPRSDAARTIEAWFKIDGTPGSDTFFNCGAGGSGTQLTLDVGATSVAIDVGGHRRGTTGLSLSGWHHLAVVFPDGAGSSDDWLVHLDAEQLALTTLSGSVQAIDTADSTVHIGRHLTTGASWSGWLDEIAIYDAAVPLRRLASHVQLATLG